MTKTPKLPAKRMNRTEVFPAERRSGILTVKSRHNKGLPYGRHADMMAIKSHSLINIEKRKIRLPE